MSRIFLFVLLGAFGAACSVFNEHETVGKNKNEITIKLDYAAAVQGANTRAVAAEHCAKYDKQAIWYGHDRDGNMRYLCQ